MKILAIDTSASFCSACIFCADQKKLLAKQSTNIGRGHAEVLMAHLDACFADAGIAMGEIGRIAVTNGPGSFTGVRVGLATAKGLAIGLSVPVIGVSTLEAAIFSVQQETAPQPVAAILDAKRDQAYFQIDDGEPGIANWDELALHFSGFDGVICGSGAEQLNQLLPNALTVAHTNESADIEGVALCSLAKTELPSTVEPIYLRSADAKKQSGAALPRRDDGA